MTETTKETEVKKDITPEVKETVTATPIKTEEAKTETTKVVVASAKPAAATKPATAGARPQRSGGNQGGRGNQRGGQRRGGKFGNRRQSEFEERVVNIVRVTTVVKGGRRFSFSAIVVVGNKKGKVGWGHGKANEVPDAIRKAIKDARNHMIVTPIIDKRTVPHENIGNFLASNVLVKPAPKGKGIIASGAIRTVVELAGYTDIYTKSLGSRTKTNSVKATIAALAGLRTIEEIAKLRDVKLEDIKG